MHTDYAYRRRGGAIYAERAFALFMARVGELAGELIVLGRVAPDEGDARYRLPDGVELVELPYYESLADPRGLLGVFRAMRRFNAVLDDVDAVWLLGPHPFGVAFALVARLRRVPTALGVRQDLPEYTRHRHPARRPLWFAADLLDSAWRALARRIPTVVVGPALARRYRAAGELLQVLVSLVDEGSVVSLEAAKKRAYDGELRLLSVGRIETEKNPLMLAEILAALTTDGRSWSLSVCGEGPLRAELEERLRELGVADRARFLGYVQHGDELARLYRESHVLVHTSWTEGLPQVMLEALAAGLPVVATDVGGIAEALGHCAELVAPGDVDGFVTAVRRVVEGAEERDRLVSRGLETAREHTLSAEAARVAEFLHPPVGREVT